MSRASVALVLYALDLVPQGMSDVARESVRLMRSRYWVPLLQVAAAAVAGVA